MLTGIQRKIRILVVDDHPIVHEGLEMVFSREKDFEICGFADSASAALAMVDKTEPDLVIIDISLKGGVSGIELIKGVRGRYPELKMLVLSMHEESIYAERVIRAGARGYVKKEEMSDEITIAIKSVMKGKIYLNPSISLDLIDSLIFDQSNRNVQNDSILTNRELEVLDFIGKGYKSRDIAKKLNVSTRTIDSHRLKIKNKLKFNNNAEVMKYAIEWLSKKDTMQK